MSTQPQYNESFGIFDYLNLILSKDGPANGQTRFLLISLFKFENKITGRCNPSIETLMATTGQKRNWVVNHIDDAERTGWLEVKRRHRKVNNYILKVPPESRVGQTNSREVLSLPNQLKDGSRVGQTNSIEFAKPTPIENLNIEGRINKEGKRNNKVEPAVLFDSFEGVNKETRSALTSSWFHLMPVNEQVKLVETYIHSGRLPPTIRWAIQDRQL